MFLFFKSENFVITNKNYWGEFNYDIFDIL
jgi:hypothetical protein